jgi:hypothetical protein
MRPSITASLIALCAALTTPAVAAPGLVPVQGVLTTAEGAPLDGPTSVQFALYASETAGAPYWTEAQTLDVDDGFFTAYLGDVEALDMALFADAPVTWLGVAIGSDAELPRLVLGEAGRAGYAQVCGDSATLGGLSPLDFAMAAGDGLTLSGGAISLSAAGCGPGDVLKRSASGDSWLCGPDLIGEGGDIGAVGAGLVLANGTLSVDAAAVEAWARGVCFDSTDELTAALAGLYKDATYEPSWSELIDIPPGFADGIDDSSSYSAGEGVTISGGVIGLKPAELGTLGGVAAGACAVGDAVVGIGSDGVIQCAPVTPGGGPSAPPLSANEPTKLSAGSDFFAVDLVTDGDFVYYATKTEVGRIAAAGGIPQSLSSGHGDLRGLVIDDTYVYFADFGSSPSAGAIGRVPRAGGDTEIISTSVTSAQRPTGLVIDGTTLFWGADNALYALSTTGGAPLSFSAGKAELVTRDATHLWFVRNNMVLRLSFAGGTPAPIVRVPNPTALHVGTDFILAASSTLLYRIPKAGGRPSLLMTPGVPLLSLSSADGWAYAVTQVGAVLVTAVDGSTAPDTISIGGGGGLEVHGGVVRFSGSNVDGFGVMAFPAPL